MDIFIETHFPHKHKHIYGGLVWEHVQDWGTSTGVVAWTIDRFEIIFSI